MDIFGVMNYTEDIMITQKNSVHRIVWRRLLNRTDISVLVLLILGFPLGPLFGAIYSGDLWFSGLEKSLQFLIVGILLSVIYLIIRILVYFHKSTMRIIFDHSNKVLKTPAGWADFDNIKGLRLISWSIAGKRARYGNQEHGIQLQTEDGKSEIVVFYNPHLKPKPLEYWRNVIYSMEKIFCSELNREIMVHKKSVIVEKPKNVS